MFLGRCQDSLVKVLDVHVVNIAHMVHIVHVVHPVHIVAFQRFLILCCLPTVILNCNFISLQHNVPQYLLL